MLGGGGVLNWSFIQAGMCDELSVIILPSADGSSKTATLFKARENLAADKPIGFTLKYVENLSIGCVWLRYAVNNAVINNKS